MRIFTIASFLCGTGLLAWSQDTKNTDFRPYYLRTARIYADGTLSINERIGKLKELRGEFGELLPNELYQVGVNYEKLEMYDSAKVYLNKANDLGLRPYDKKYIEKYNMVDIAICDTGYFAEHNLGRARLVYHIQQTDQAIRQNGDESYCAMRIIDSVNISRILDENLLAFSNSAYEQTKAWVVCMHGWRFYKRDPQRIEAYLMGLVKQGELHPELYARLIDTYNIDVNGYQIYGTIGRVRENKLILTRPFLEPDRIDEYRLRIGFMPMQEWLASQEVEGCTVPTKYTRE